MKILHKTILAIAALGISSTAALAQSDYYQLSQFEGFYVGAYGGADMSGTMTPSAGGIAGANFVITDYILAGAEVQGGAKFGATTSYDVLMLGKLGYEISDNLMVYGAGGGGLINGVTSYAVGGGAEAIVIDQIGVRAEALATGSWGGAINATKISAGLLWHLQ